MSDWKEQAATAYDGRPADEKKAPLVRAAPLRAEARKIIIKRLTALGIVPTTSLTEAPEDHSHVEVDGVEFYIGQTGELWGHVKTDDGKHSWDMPIRALADAGELLAHKSDMDAGVHPDPRPEGPLEAKATIGS